MSKQKATLCVHEGAIHHKGRGVNTPLYNSSAFGYLDNEDRVYPRYFNTPNQEVVSKKIAALEKAEEAMIFGSGMAAISTVIFGLLKSGDHVLALNNLYGGTLDMLKKEFEKFGLKYTVLEENTLECMKACLTPETKMIFLESPSNPLLEVVDIKKISQWARSQNILSCIDNTFATPIFQNPISLGIDISLHSATKYLGGHSDICAGAVASSKKIMDEIRSASHNFGGSLNPMMCHLLERSLKTLDIRVKKQSENALALAQFLEEHEKAIKVNYPGLPSNKSHRIAKEQMSGFGGMLSFEVDVDPIKFQKELKVICPVMSLGGVESTICSPAMTSHRLLSEDQRKKFGIENSLLRLSVGIEHIEDLKEDLNNAFYYASPFGPPKVIGNEVSGN